MMNKIKLSQNLIYYREKNSLTQNQLSELLGYTPKSISKWETSKGLPTLEVVVKLSEILKVSVDELLFGNRDVEYFLGIDGGGTKTDFLLVNQNFEVIKSIKASASNPNDIGIERSKEIIKDGINEICQGIPFNSISVFAGIAGGGIKKQADAIKAMLSEFGFKYFRNGSDVENLAALTQDKEKIVVIMGTGFSAFAVGDNTMIRFGGWGQLFDEGGSAYTFGRDAVYAALKQSDATGGYTIISDILKERIHDTVENHLSDFYKGKKRYIATFADVVFDAYKKGDISASEIIEKNMKFVANNINTAAKTINTQGELAVYFAGGLSSESGILFPFISKYLDSKNLKLICIKEKPVYGAVNIAVKESHNAIY